MVGPLRPDAPARGRRNRALWAAKFARNKAREREVTRILLRTGWRVLRVWEGALTQARSTQTAGRLVRMLAAARGENGGAAPAAERGGKWLSLANRLATLRGMPTYPDFIDRLFLHDELLRKLTPSEPVSTDLLLRVRAADDAALSGGQTIGHAGNFALVRGGLFFALDALDEAHAFFQDAPGDLGSYWHGMLHRREGDFDNARYWYRRAGALPCFAALHRAASEFSADMAKQANWDPYLLAGECEQARFGAEESVAQLVQLQRVEFDGLFNYTWRQSALG